jgi:hypothetical protein
MAVFRRFCSYSPTNEVHVVDSQWTSHEKQLELNLTRHDMHRVRVTGDGNCLFYAFAHGLIRQMQVDPHRFGYHLEHIYQLSANNIHPSDFANRLRQICVAQWISQEQSYSPFVDQQHLSFRDEVSKLSHNGVCDSALGDIIPLTIANTFNIRIIIFTSLSRLPRIDVQPENSTNASVRSLKIIFLAYNQHGLGHYDAAYPR